MKAILTNLDLQKLLPDYPEDHIHCDTLPQIGLNYIDFRQKMILTENNYFLNRYVYTVEVIDERLFFLKSIESGVVPEIINEN